MKDNSVTNWLKKIFSIQSISLIVATFGAYFTFKAYLDNRPSQLSVEFPILTEEQDSIDWVNTDNVSRYFSIGFYDIPPISFNNGAVGGTNNMLMFPFIVNRSDKSLNNFTADIYIWYDDVMKPLFVNRQELELSINTTYYDIKAETNYSIHLSYNRNYLGANRSLPYPIGGYCFVLYPADKAIASRGGEIHFDYYITYDGAKEPIAFQYVAKFFYSGSEDSEYSNEFVSHALYNFLRDDVFANTYKRREYENGEWVVISKNYIHRDIKHLSSKDFEELTDYSWSNLQN